jgi:hypothetical protein
MVFNYQLSIQEEALDAIWLISREMICPSRSGGTCCFRFSKRKKAGP